MTRTATRSCKRETFCAHFRLHDQPTLTIPLICRHVLSTQAATPEWWSPNTSGAAPSSRIGASAMFINGRLVLFGGWDYSSGANDLYAAPGLLAFPEASCFRFAASRFDDRCRCRREQVLQRRARAGMSCRFPALCSSSVLCVATTCCLRRTRAAGTGAPRPPLPLPQHRVRPQFRQAVFFLRNRLCSEAL